MKENLASWTCEVVSEMFIHWVGSGDGMVGNGYSTK